MKRLAGLLALPMAWIGIGSLVAVCAHALGLGERAAVTLGGVTPPLAVIVWTALGGLRHRGSPSGSGDGK